MSKRKAASPGQILSRHFNHLKRENQGLSVRSIAAKLGVSAPYLFRVLNDQTPFPMKRFQDFVKAFKLDSISRVELLKTIALRTLELSLLDGSGVTANEIRQIISSSKDFPDGEEFELMPPKQFDLLSRWYYLAILDISTCQGFKPDPSWIAKRLRIPEQVAQSALETLIAKGFLVADADGLKKRTRRIRFPTKSSQATVRKFHIQMANKAVQTLTKQADEFDRRLINGVVFAANPEHLESAKAILNRALYEIAELMADDECTEVYYVAGHLFPLTRKT